MSYTRPDDTSFKARFPEFAPVSKNLIDLVLEEAVSSVGETWMESDRAKAQMLLVAHTLASEGEPGRSIDIANGGDGASFLQNGGVKRDKVGDVETEFVGTASSAGSSSDFTSTVYGRRYLALVRANFSGPLVV